MINDILGQNNENNTGVIWYILIINIPELHKQCEFK